MSETPRRAALRATLVGAAAALCVGSFGLVAAPAAYAADPYPSKEIRFVVPWNAGGSNDIAARAIANILGEQGVRVIVENLPGEIGRAHV